VFQSASWSGVNWRACNAGLMLPTRLSAPAHVPYDVGNVFCRVDGVHNFAE
jgi:hypothetical protein